MDNFYKLMNRNDASVAIFDDLAARKRHRDRSDLRKMFVQLENKYGKLDYNQFLETWKNLEANGFGSVILGRGPNPPRFAWNYNLKDALTVINGKKNLDEIPKLKKTPRGPGAGIVNNQPMKVLVVDPKTKSLVTFKVPASKADEIYSLLKGIEWRWYGPCLLYSCAYPSLIGYQTNLCRP